MTERIDLQNVSKKVLAFYYGWYGNPDTSGRWVHWKDVDVEAKSIGGSTNFPQLGAYDSHDPQVVEQHCQWAAEAGIDAFIATWWHPHDYHDEGLPLLLDTAQKHGLEVTVYFETVPGEDPDKALEYVRYLLDTYRDHPAWLKVEGKPVLFIYGRAVNQIGIDGWGGVIQRIEGEYGDSVVFIGDVFGAAGSKDTKRVFDGIHAYNPTGLTQGKSPEELCEWARTVYPLWAAAGPEQLVCVTVLPGYDDTEVGRPDPRPITDRHDGQTYRILWEEAIAADPAWVLICTWNEWHEGSEIEPSVENGDRALRATAEFTVKFKG